LPPVRAEPLPPAPVVSLGIGEPRQTDDGVLHVTQRRYAATHRHGDGPLAAALQAHSSHVAALALVSYRDGLARLDLRGSSGTYVRAIATELGGHCTTLRRTEVGPFRVEEADPERLLAAEDALARL